MSTATANNFHLLHQQKNHLRCCKVSPGLFDKDDKKEKKIKNTQKELNEDLFLLFFHFREGNNSRTRLIYSSDERR